MAGSSCMIGKRAWGNGTGLSCRQMDVVFQSKVRDCNG